MEKVKIPDLIKVNESKEIDRKTKISLTISNTEMNNENEIYDKIYQSNSVGSDSDSRPFYDFTENIVGESSKFDIKDNQEISRKRIEMINNHLTGNQL